MNRLIVSTQRVSPFYRDLDLGLVGLVGNLLLVEQLLSCLVVEQLLNPIPSSNHVSRKSLGGGRGDENTSSYMTSPVSIMIAFGTP